MLASLARPCLLKTSVCCWPHCFLSQDGKEGATVGCLLRVPPWALSFAPSSWALLWKQKKKMTSFPLGLVPGKNVVRLDGTMVPSEECGRSPVTPHETSDDTGLPLHQDSGLEPKECAAAPLRGALNPAWLTHFAPLVSHPLCGGRKGTVACTSVSAATLCLGPERGSPGQNGRDGPPLTRSSHLNFTFPCVSVKKAVEWERRDWKITWNVFWFYKEQDVKLWIFLPPDSA